ncbi:hypothetical protein GCM10020295_40670 [Streptomyces cinereospinus]
MTNEPVSLPAALASFTEQWSPRIATTVNDYDVRVTHVEGEHLWHVHENTDEFFLVLEGELHISLREPAGERTVILPGLSVFTVPRGVEHKPYAPPSPRTSCSWNPPAPPRSATATKPSPPTWTRRPAAH